MHVIHNHTQVAELVGETKEHVWDIISKFALQLDQLQQKDETIASATPLDPDTISNQYWRRVADNLIDLSKKFDSRQQVRQSVSNLILGFCLKRKNAEGVVSKGLTTYMYWRWETNS